MKKTLLWTAIFLLAAKATAIETKQPSAPPVGKLSGKPFHQAGIEDIDSKNFPDLIKSFDYPKASIGDMIKVMSHLTGINFIIDPSVTGNISIVAPSPITVAEAFQAFLSALSIHGFALVRSGAFWKIISAEKASQDNVQVYTGDYFPDADQYITKIFKLKHTNVKSLEVHLKQFLTKDKHKVIFYPEANTIIVSDYGSSIEKISRIIKELDIPDVNNLVEVVTIKHAPAMDLAGKLRILISQATISSMRQTRRFKSSSKPGSGLISNLKGNSSGVSAIIPDERTNSVIISGTKEGIEKIKSLIKKLDFYIDPQIAGGIFVYYVKHGVAKDIATTLNNILNPKISTGKGKKNTPRSQRFRNPVGYQGLFGSTGIKNDIGITEDENTNSLLVTASKHDYNILKGILSKIDIPKNQVFIKTIIMDISAENNLNWDISMYKFLERGSGSELLPRIGFSSLGIQDLLSLGNESILNFGSGNLVDVNLPSSLSQFLPQTQAGRSSSEDSGSNTQPPASLDKAFKIPSILSLIKVLKVQNEGNILSTPQIIAIDNEESSIRVGLDAPVSETSQVNNAGLTTTSQVRKDVFTELTITPRINPDGQSVRLNINQKINSLSQTSTGPQSLVENAVTIVKREIKTNVILNNEETAVIGGLMSDEEQDVVKKVPILGDIPILGWLFKSSSREKKKKNLVVFITPKIIKNSADYRNLMRDKIDERIDFIKKFMGGEDIHHQQIQRILSEQPADDMPVEANSSGRFQTAPLPKEMPFKEMPFENEEDLEPAADPLSENSLPPVTESETHTVEESIPSEEFTQVEESSTATFPKDPLLEPSTLDTFDNTSDNNDTSLLQTPQTQEEE